MSKPHDSPQLNHLDLTLPQWRLPNNNPETDVMLRVQCLSSQAVKAVVLQATALQLVVISVFITFVTLEATHVRAQSHTQPLLKAAASFACFCLALLVVQVAMLVRGIHDNWKAGKQWTHRKRQLVTIVGTPIVLLLLTCMLWASTSLWAIAGNHPCRVYDNYCRWAFAIQWSLLNAVLLFQLVFTHAATTWRGPNGLPLQYFLLQKDSWLRKAPGHAIVGDAPVAAHAAKLLPWAVLQASIIIQLVASPQGQAHACRSSEVVTVPCTYSGLFEVYKILAYVGLGIYIAYHFAYSRLGRKHASIVPYSSFRIGLAMMRVQEGSIVGVTKFAVACVAWMLAIIYQPSNCMPCAQDSMYIVLILQGMRLTAVQTFFFVPKSFSANKPIVVQEWVHHFAWTERSQSQKLAERQRLVPQQQQESLAERPIFCFETAIKLLYWCGLVYELDEGRKEEKLSKRTAMDMFGLESLQLVRCEEANVKCLVAWGGGSLLLAFRGTANFTNALADIKAWMVDEAPTAAHHYFTSSPKVHSGFHYAWQVSGLRQRVLDLVRANCSEATAGRLHVILTGHSLGGAMANLAAVDLAKMMPWASIKVYTVGAPRAGNHAFAKEYNQLIPDSFAIMNYRDPVPKMAKFFWLYARPGEKVLLLPHGDMVVCPTPLDAKLQGFRRWGRVNNHKLAAYRAALVQILQAQLKDHRTEADTDLLSVLGLADNPALKEALLKEDADSVYTSLSRLPRRSRKPSESQEEDPCSGSLDKEDLELQAQSEGAAQNPPHTPVSDQLAAASKVRQYFHPIFNLLPTF